MTDPTPDPTTTLAAWRAVTEGATDGPWEVGDRYHIQGANYCTCRPDYGPLVWEGKRDINGQVMQAHIHRRPQPLWDGDTSIYGGTLPEPVVVALSTSEYVEIAPENAAFIATARDAMPRLIAFAEAVLSLAASSGAWKGDRHIRVEQRTEYGSVTRSAVWVDDLRALAEHLGGEGR